MMTKFDLVTMARRVRNIRKSTTTLRDIAPTGIFATDLYHAAYQPVVQLWQRTAAQAATTYDTSLSELITDAVTDINPILDRAEDEFGRLFLMIRPGLEAWAGKLEKWHRNKWVANVLAGTGVDLTTLIGPEDMRQTVAATVEWNASLVQDVSSQARKRIADAAFSGLRNSTPAREVAKEIRAAAEMSRDRSVRIASDQMQKLSASLADERRRQAGIEEWEWLHSQKLHPRADHVARNGKIYSDANPPPTMPGAEPYCGCRQRAVLRWD